MNIDRIQYLLEVAKCGSFTVAANHLHVTQSALSQAVTSLEEELGNKIFIRSRKGVELTLFGRTIIKKASDLLLKYHDLIEEAQSWANELKGELRVASIPGTMPILIKVLTNLKKEYPNLSIAITEKGTNEIIKDLFANQCDVGLINVFEGTFQNDGLKFETLISGYVQAGFNKNSSLGTEMTIMPEELLNHHLIIYDDEAINWYIQQFERRYGKLKILFRTNNTDAIRSALHDKVGITLVIDYCVKYEPTLLNGENKALYISSEDISAIKLGIIRPSKRPTPPILSIFLDQFRLEFHKSSLSMS